MKIISLMKEALYKIDFFNSTAVLRYREQPQYRTLTGGCVSLAITITILVSFTNLILTTLEKIQITSTSVSTRDYDPPESMVSTYADSMFMFGIEIQYHDLNHGDRYFDVIFQNQEFVSGQITNNTVSYKLQPCRKDHWASYPKVAADYDRLKMSNWLCPPLNTTYYIKGKFSSSLSKTLQIAVKTCKNETDLSRPCANQSAIDAFFADNGYFYYTIYFMNPLINPSQQDYIDVYLEDNNYITFNDKIGSEAIMYLNDYTITTDQSIWPFTDTREEKGSLMKDLAFKSSYTINSNVENYCSFTFFKGTEAIVYTRDFKKLLDAVSYIGGLFGAVTTALLIFTIYSEYSFQMTIGGSLFKPAEEDDENLMKKYNFLKFVACSVYGALKTMNICSCWTTMNKYLDGREHMLKQLDVLYLFERVQFLERSICALLTDHQYKGLHLQGKITMEEAKKIRSHYDLRKNILKRMDEVDEEKINSQKNHEGEFPSKNQINLVQSVNHGNLKDSKKIYPEKNANGLMNSVIKKFQEMSSEDCSQTDLLEEFDLTNDLQKLKEEAENGCKISQKIWKKIDEEIIQNLTQLKSKDNIMISKMNDEGERSFKMKQQVQQHEKLETEIFKNAFKGENSNTSQINQESSESKEVELANQFMKSSENFKKIKTLRSKSYSQVKFSKQKLKDEVFNENQSIQKEVQKGQTQKREKDKCSISIQNMP